MLKAYMIKDSNDNIAESLKISPRTVHFHLQNCYKKLGYEFNARNQTRVVIEYRTYVGV
jgi:DNA-binding NarL/FixJ family response regulator